MAQKTRAFQLDRHVLARSTENIRAPKVRVVIDGESAREVERYPLDHRLREIREAPDGTIWLLEDGKDAKLRKLSPKP